MNENAKKASLIVLVVVALVAAVWQGYRFAMGPTEIIHEVGHGIPGHGMKAQENAELKKAGAQANGDDPLSGPIGKTH